MASIKDLNQKLLQAVKNGDINSVKSAITKGADVNSHDEVQRTPLHFAVVEGTLEIAEFLLKNGADPNIKNEFGETPLHWAAAKNDNKMLELLLQNSADPNTTNCRNGNSLHFATSSDYKEDVRLHVFDEEKRWKNAFKQFFGIDEDKKGSFQTGGSPDNFWTVEQLLHFGANPNATDNVGNTALHYACIEGSANTIECLLSQGADNMLNNDDGVSPLKLCRKDIINVFAQYDPIVALNEVFEWSVETFKDEQVFEKHDHGFQVIIPPLSVKEGKKVNMKVQVIAPPISNIKTPEKVDLVSCIYKVGTDKSHETFSRPVKFCLQHNVDIKSTQQLVFLRACGPPPHIFVEVKGQPLDHNDSKYLGVVQACASSVLVAVGSCSSQICRYAMTVFFKEITKSSWQIKAIITKDLGPFVERIKTEKCFCNWRRSKPVVFHIDPDVEVITLPHVNDSFITKPLANSQVSKEDIDKSQLDSALLCLHFCVQLKDNHELTDLELTFNDIKDMKTLVISSNDLEDITSQHYDFAGIDTTLDNKILCAKPKVKHLMTLLNKIRNKWELIGIQLGINQAEIVDAKVKVGLQNDTQRLAHILQLWIDKHSCKPSWKKIVSIVEEPPIADKEIVEEIHQFLTRLNIQHEYISQDAIDSNHSGDSTRSGSRDDDISVPLLATMVVLGALSAAAMAYFKFT